MVVITTITVQVPSVTESPNESNFEESAGSIDALVNTDFELEARKEQWRKNPNDAMANYVASRFYGICIAGSVYPFIIGVCVALYNLPWIRTVDQLGWAFVSLVIFSCIGAFIGVIISGITGLASICLAIVFNMSLGRPLDPRSVAISTGSLAGYIPTVWILFDPYMGRNLEFALIGFVGPILAMSLGAYGAAWSASAYGGSILSAAPPRHRHQLSILNMMVATTWIAVTFAIANMFGGIGFAIAAAGWFLLNGILLGAVYLYRRRSEKS